MGKRERLVKEEREKEEEGSEDYCFVCKDGGLLIVCDHKDCVKAYHPHCVGKEELTEEEEKWICDWHKCLLCKQCSNYQCFGCPNAVCKHCFKDVAFARVRGSKGFCNDCLNLALLGDEGMEVDSDGEKVDFKDQETYEGLFKEYWDIIKEKEGLTLDDLHNADVQIKKSENVRFRSHNKDENIETPYQKSDSVSEECNKEKENKGSSFDIHDSDNAERPILARTKKRPKKSQEKCKGPKTIEFVGWASKILIEFLTSIGVGTSKKLSQDDVASLINKYVQEQKLFHPEKKKVVLCDLRLFSLLGRRTINMHKIHDVLERHFLENIEQSEDEDEGFSSCEENNASLSTKKQAWWRKLGSFQHHGSLLDKFQPKEAMSEEANRKETVVKVQYSSFAMIILKNMKLMYLKRSLVELLMEQYDTFESKVVGSFVKVKSDPVDAKRPYQLLPVTEVSKASGDESNGKICLQVSTLPNEVPLCLLSNDDLSEEDCEDLRQKVENGLLEKPTVVQLEKKAKSLHEDITKYWINRELSILRHRIDLANEKGRRVELFEYRRRRDLLQSQEEQSRLLKEVPQVVADTIEIKPASEPASDPANLAFKPASKLASGPASEPASESVSESEESRHNTSPVIIVCALRSNVKFEGKRHTPLSVLCNFRFVVKLFFLLTKSRSIPRLID